METHADVNFFNRNASNSSGVTTQNTTNMAVPTEKKVVARPRPVYRRSDSCYDMSGDKYALIFNHKTYKHTPYFKARPSERDGTDEDVEKLCATLGCRGYSVSVRDNLDHAEIMADVQMLCNSDHRNTSLVSIFILTHGMSGGIVYAADRPYSLESIMTLLQNGNEYLVGKPKLLFVQACRGGHTDNGRPVQTDNGENIVLPTASDCLVMYSSYPNYLSFRDCRGSWMIRSLCQVIEENDQQDIFKIILKVNDIVARKTSNNTECPEIHKKKQIPETKFTLTKTLYLV